MLPGGVERFSLLTGVQNPKAQGITGIIGIISNDSFVLRWFVTIGPVYTGALQLPRSGGGSPGELASAR